MDKKPHICTIRQLAKETGVSEYAIRMWVKQDKFKTLRSGNKYLINYDIFMKFLNGEAENNNEFEETTAANNDNIKIRKAVFQ